MTRRTGLTLIELVVVIAIIGILASLLLVGVQYSREASRRTHCSNNLRQFVVAVSIYESTWRVLPAGSNLQGHSPHYSVLPYMERSELVTAAHQNRYMAVALYRCPSDSGTPILGPEGPEARPTTSYVCNSGTWWESERGFDGPFRYWDPHQLGGPPFSMSAMTRGLSNTSAISEVIRADGSTERLRVNWDSPAPRFTSYSQIDQFDAYCRNLPADPSASGMIGNRITKGAGWSQGNVAITLYNHVTPPNQPSSFNDGDVVTAAFSASSFHNGIVNVAYLDGHVAACSDQIDIHAWRALAPRTER